MAGEYIYAYIALFTRLLTQTRTLGGIYTPIVHQFLGHKKPAGPTFL